MTTGLTVGEALAQAREQLRGGRRAEAEALCRAVLQAAPREAEAYRLLGAVAFCAGQLAARTWRPPGG